MARGGRAAGAVEVVGDRFAPPALVGPEVEDLDDDRRLVGVGDESRLGLAGLGAGGDGVGVCSRLVAVGGAAAAAEALDGVVAHAALGFARELLALVLVEGLLQRDQQPALGGRGVAGADRVVDIDPDLAQLAVEQARGTRSRDSREVW